MAKNLQSVVLDDLDREILHILQEDSRISNVDLAHQINLSPPATHKRVKWLKENGYIQKYAAILDREKAGYDLLCFVHIGLQMPQATLVEHFREITRELPEVLECYHLTGEYDYLVKVVLRNRKELEDFIVNKITPIPGVIRIYTSLMLVEVKATTTLALK
jgi:DNA-binding Lrp family transcriptional regulator